MNEKQHRFLLLPALILCMLGLCLQFKTLIMSGFTVTPSDAVDPRLNGLILENLHRFLIGKLPFSEFFNVPYYFPVKDVGTWTDTLWGAGIFYSCFRWIGLSMTTSYSSWILCLTLLNFFSANHVLSRQFNFKPLGSALGAFLFAFGAPRMTQVGHAQLFPAFATPFFFGYLFQAFLYFPVLNRRAFGLALIALIVQIYCGFYLGWFLCLTLFLLLVFSTVHKSSRPGLWLLIQNNFRFGALAALLGLIALIPQLVPFLRAARIFGARPYSGVRATFPRINSFFHLGQENVMEPWLSKLIKADELPLSHEHKMGIGIITTLVVIAGFYLGKRARSPVVVRALLVAALIIAISISFYKASLWGLVYLVFPGGKAIRVASRIILVLLFVYSVGLAYFIDRLKMPFQIALTLIVCLEQWTLMPTTSVAFLQDRVTRVTAFIPAPCDVFFLMQVKSSLSIDEFQMDAMMVSFQRSTPTLNGYYGHDPLAWRLSPGDPEKLKEWEALHHFSVSPSCVIKI